MNETIPPAFACAAGYILMRYFFEQWEQLPNGADAEMIDLLVAVLDRLRQDGGLAPLGATGQSYLELSAVQRAGDELMSLLSDLARDNTMSVFPIDALDWHANAAESAQPLADQYGLAYEHLEGEGGER